MGLFAIKEPLRKPDSKVDIICDLDSVVEKRAAFTIRGKTHFIEPITTKLFIDFVSKLSEISKIKDDADLVRQGYYDMIRGVCKSITMDEINTLTHAQSIMLFGAICDKIMGRKPMSEEEKKNS